MEVGRTEEGEMPIPINSSYGHMIHHDPTTITVPHSHNHIMIPVSPPRMTSINGVVIEEEAATVPYKKMVKYRECMKNHAASMGGNATDGCGEFMPSGEEGSLEALTCSACNCHRNFHRKEIEGEASSMDFYTNPHRFGRKIIVGHPQKSFSGHHGHLHSRVAPPPAVPHHHQMIMSYNMGSFPSESDEQDDGGNGNGGGNGGNGGGAPPLQMMKKRHRTKFTPEQKEKMLNFAEKAGWKIQKQEEGVVQQFCQEVGIKRRVLKVWMHNNKHNLAKKMMINTNGNTLTLTDDGGPQIQL